MGGWRIGSELERNNPKRSWIELNGRQNGVGILREAPASIGSSFPNRWRSRIDFASQTTIFLSATGSGMMVHGVHIIHLLFFVSSRACFETFRNKTGEQFPSA